MKTTSAKILASVAVAFGALTISGCSVNLPLPDISLSDLQSSVEGLQNLAEGATNFSAQDLMYAQMMIPHHEQAVEISELAATRTSNPEVLAIAKQIKSAQAPEIATMAAWLGGKVAEVHAGHSMEMMGMLSGAEIKALKDSVDDKFDQLFVKGMIAHHEGAIQMTQSVLNSENPIVKALGEKIVKEQTAEIEQLKNILG